MNLKHKTFAAVRWTTAAAIARAVLQLGQIAVLARLLAPEDYGLMAMVSVVISFASFLSDFGINSAFIQRQSVSLEQRSSLFWFNFCVSAALAIVVIILSPILSLFFGDHRLTPLLMLAALSFVLAAPGLQVRIAAEKALQFRPVVLTEISAALLGFIVAVVSALAGFGVYSLIFGMLINILAQSILSWCLMSRGWRPMWRLKGIDIQPFLGFGSALVINNIINHVNASMDLLLGGRLLTVAALGLYSLPRNLVLQIQSMINPIITRVGFPLIAQVQTDIPAVRSIYLQTLNMTASINAPLYVGLAFFAPEVASLLFGAKWLPAVEGMRILAVWGGIRSTGNPVGSLLLGMGRADLSLKWNLTLLCIVPPALWTGSHFGTIGLAWTLLSINSVIFLPSWFFLVRPLCHARLWDYITVTLMPFVLACVAIAPTYWITGQIQNALLRLTVAVTIAMILYFMASYTANRSWLKAMLFLIMPKRASQTQ